MRTINLFSFVSRLTGIQRFSMLKACHPEDVLAHTGMVVVFCYVLVDHLNQLEPGSIDMGVTLQRATVHDWDETISGDVVRPTKNFSQTMRSEMASLEQVGLRNIARHLELKNVIEDHALAKDGKIGAIVSIADIMAAIHRVWEETLIYNNHHFVHPAQGMCKVLRGVHDKVLDQDFTEKQITFLIEIFNELNNVLERVLAHHCELVELHDANH